MKMDSYNHTDSLQVFHNVISGMGFICNFWEELLPRIEDSVCLISV